MHSDTYGSLPGRENTAAADTTARRMERKADFTRRMIKTIRRPVPVQLVLYLQSQRKALTTTEISKGLEDAGFRLSYDSLRRYLSALEDAGQMKTARRRNFQNTKPAKTFLLQWK